MRRRPAPRAILEGAMQLSGESMLRSPSGGTLKPLSPTATAKARLGQSVPQHALPGHRATTPTDTCVAAAAAAPVPTSKQRRRSDEALRPSPEAQLVEPMVTKRTPAVSQLAPAPESASALLDKTRDDTAASLAATCLESEIDIGPPPKGKGKGTVDMQSMVHCSVTTEGTAAQEIRTKVFRMGAPLLRTTIPVVIGGRGGGYPGGYPDAATNGSKGPGYGGGGNDLPIAPAAKEEDASDVETVISMDDMDCADPIAISVTLDFPC